ncbi:transcriptional regulator [Hafnia alvei]|jgi:two-component system response regulator AtoC|uniref:acetoacetate metabolism transcriptional regulator AtoC n=1 Tax=Hafnia alvei TaxID=569 RepID=UPI0007BC9B7E|nr:acetoacetate metabolism transcriptional regulator AtoC [Hafnia alvei]ANC40576.1 transcriptional regulator [Hafnia alvei]
MMNYNILIADDEKNVLKMLTTVFSHAGNQIISADNGKDALRLFKQDKPDIVLMDIRMPEMSGIEALQLMREFDADTPIILMTAYAAVETAVEALRLGAFDYVIKPFELDELKLLMSRAIQLREMKQEINILHRELSQSYHCDRILTNNPKMMELCRAIAKVAQSHANVLVSGESGTGKELIAKAIHYNSQRAKQPFIKVNCGALPESLLESELFGHEKGAFTGAQMQRQGLFERAHQGTLLLDEIGEMPLNLQVKLLRILQEQEFERVGGSQTIKTNVRIVAATNRDLNDMIAQGEFRRDLYYRLNVMHLYSLPLRERPEDILLLARYFLQKFSVENNKDIIGFDVAVIHMLEKHSWLGNVRELANVVEHAVIMSTGYMIFVDDLPVGFQREITPDVAVMKKEPKVIERLSMPIKLKESLKQYEKEIIERTLVTYQGNRIDTAKALGISRRALMYKLQEYSIN